MTWYDPAWQARRRITVDGAQVPSALSGFPVRVTIEDLPFASASADDVLFALEDGTKLPHQMAVAAGLNLDCVWTWFSSPRAIYANGAMYVGITRLNGDAAIGRYDNVSGAYTEFTLSAALQVDDHLTVSPGYMDNGKIIAVYQRHNDNALRVRISSSADSIAAFDAETNLVGGILGGGYPSTFVVSGTVFILYTADTSGTSRSLFYIKSDDNGATWSTPVEVFKNLGERPYYHAWADLNNKRIHIGITDGHPNEVSPNSVYHFVMHTASEEFFLADGTGPFASFPLAPADVTKIYDSGSTGFQAWTTDAGVSVSGNPSILFYEYRDAAEGALHQGVWLMCASWNGAAWSVAEVCHTGWSIAAPDEHYYPGGACFGPGDTTTIYVSEERDGHRSISRYTLSGGVWSFAAVESEVGYASIHPTQVLDYAAASPAEIVYLCGHYAHYLGDYDMALCTHPRIVKTSRIDALVKVDLNSGTDTEFFVYYDNAAAADQRDDAGSRATGTILHGVGSYARLRVGTPAIEGAAALSAEWRFFLAEGQPSGDMYVASQWDGSVQARWMLRIDGGAAGDPLEGFLQLASGQIGGVFTGANVTAGQWEYGALYYDGSALKASINGTESGTTFAGSGNLNATAAGVAMGGVTPHASSFGATIWGHVDFFDIATVARSADWRTTRQNNFADAGFITLGSEESQPAAGGGGDDETSRHARLIALGLIE